MRKLVAVLAVLAASCAETHQQTCLTLDGTYKLVGSCSHKGSGGATFVFADGVSIRNVSSVTIAQPGCTVMLHVTGSDGTAKEVTLDHDLVWVEDGVSVSWVVHPKTSNMLPGIAEQTRTLRLQLSQPDTLTVSSEFDERGMALLFMPFHDHGQATCTLTRVKS